MAVRARWWADSTRGRGTIWCWLFERGQIQLSSTSYFLSWDSSWVRLRLHIDRSTVWLRRRELPRRSFCWNHSFRTLPWQPAFPFRQCSSYTRNRCRMVLTCRVRILRLGCRRRWFRLSRRDVLSCRGCRRWDTGKVYRPECVLRWEGQSLYWTWMLQI